MSGTLLVSVVIATFNLQEKLLMVLDSLAYQTMPPDRFEVIVVDSESEDGTLHSLKTLSPRYSLRWFSQGNKGKAAARNRGIREAYAQIVLLTDADMIADPEWIQKHYEAQKSHRFNVLVEGKTFVLNREALPVEQHIRRPYITKKLKDGQTLSFFNCLSGNLSVPRRFFEQTGYFDESYTGYGWEDIDLGYRMLSVSHRKLIYAEQAVNYHYHVWSQTEECYRRERMGQTIHLLLNKFPELSLPMGINPVNYFIWRTLSQNPKKVDQWMNLLSLQKLSMFKKLILREYYYYRGYRMSLMNRSSN